MVNVNFFDWMRQGVKQSVLLGVSDAIETMGTPAETETMDPDILAFLRSDSDSETKRVGARSPRGGARKRLGKSLNELDTAKS